MSGDAVGGLPGPAAHAAGESVGAAAAVSAELPGSAGDSLMAAAGAAFTDAVGVAMIVAAGVAFAGALLVRRYLPDARQEEPVQVLEARRGLEGAAA